MIRILLRKDLPIDNKLEIVKSYSKQMFNKNKSKEFNQTVIDTSQLIINKLRDYQHTYIRLLGLQCFGDTWNIRIEGIFRTSSMLIQIFELLKKNINKSNKNKYTYLIAKSYYSDVEIDYQRIMEIDNFDKRDNIESINYTFNLFKMDFNKLDDSFKIINHLSFDEIIDNLTTLLMEIKIK